MADDYVKFICGMKDYLDEKMVYVKEESENRGYPVARLGDIKLYLKHYKTVEEAQIAWDRRKGRINWDKLFFIMTDRNCCSEKALSEFDRFVTQNHYPGVVFTHIPHPDLKSSFYLAGSEHEPFVPVMIQFVGLLRRRMGQFDWIRWINGNGD